MANHKGSEGVVKSGANTIAEVRSYSIETQMDPIEDSVMGDTWKTHQSGMQSWSGQLNCFWDETDTNGQVALVEGASITLNLYPEGASTGDKYWTGTALITGVQLQASHDGMVESTITFQGTGSLTVATAA